MTSATYSEEFRRSCEARHWLVKMHGDPAKIKALLLRIEAKRGKEAAEILRADMRIAWRNRADSRTA